MLRLPGPTGNADDLDCLKHFAHAGQDFKKLITITGGFCIACR